MSRRSAAKIDISKLKKVKVEKSTYNKSEKTAKDIILENNYFKLNESEVDELCSLKDSSGFIINSDDHERLYEIIGLLKFITVKELIEDLKKEMYNNKDEYIFTSRVFDKELAKEYIDADLLISKPSVTNSSVKCGRCGQFKVETIIRQMKSADESATVIFICINCGNRWRE